MISAFSPHFYQSDPLFWPIAEGARAFADREDWPDVSEYGARVAHRAKVVFREQPKKPRGRRRGARCARDLYDGRIVEEGWVPTRPRSWHDFLNMLCWAAFPRAKWQLHARQHQAISARIEGAVDALPNARTREQDALALLDEGGVVVVCRDDRIQELSQLLAERRAVEAQAVFRSGAARGVVFGHAVYEHLVLGRGDAWAAAFLAPSGEHLREEEESPGARQALIDHADSVLAAALAAPGTFASPDSLRRVDLSLLRP